MTHKSKPDWCVWAGIVLAAAALFLHVGYWIAGPVLLILLLCAYPQSYELAASELVVHDSLTRRRIPYETITRAAIDSGRVRVRYGLASHVVVAPADPERFLENLGKRAARLERRGGALLPRDRYIEYGFTSPGGAWRMN